MKFTKWYRLVRLISGVVLAIFSIVNSSRAESPSIWQEAFPEPAGSINHFVAGAGESIAGFLISNLAQINLRENGSLRAILAQERSSLSNDAARREFDTLLAVRDGALVETQRERSALELERAEFWRQNTREFGPPLNRSFGRNAFAEKMRLYNVEIARLKAIEAELSWQASRASTVFDQAHSRAEQRLSAGSNLTANEQRVLSRVIRGRRLNVLFGLGGLLFIYDGFARVIAMTQVRDPGYVPAINFTATAIKRSGQSRSIPIELGDSTLSGE